MNSRRYHGLLVAAVEIPVRRAVLLSKIEETLVVNGERFDLSTNQYPGVLHPVGYRYLASYETDPFPIFRFQAGGIELEKRVFLVHGENTAVISYQLRNLHRHADAEYSLAQVRHVAAQQASENMRSVSEPRPQGSGRDELALELRPLLAFRDYHAMSHSTGAMNPSFETDSDGVIQLRPYRDLPSLYIASSGGSVEPTGNWYYNFEYAREQERGFFEREDLFNPFVIRCPLKAGAVQHVVASLQRRTADEAESLFQSELKRRMEVARMDPPRGKLVSVLTKAADQFIVRRGNGHTVIAGYHWFTDWGRDTMISLPGLTLSTGRPQIAREILRTFAPTASQGMIPNRFGDGSGAPEWNTVDGTLWMFEAARCYLAETNDWAFVRDELYPVFQDMVAWHRRGTRYGIQMNSDGLLSAGEALTWMDARVEGRAVTPRDGKAVEIQALWFNALSTLLSFAERRGDENYAADLSALIHLIKSSFLEHFWNAGTGCLFDVVRDGGRDPAVRPNQLFAVSLQYPLVEGERAKQILQIVRDKLLTPRGLRTLAPDDPNYRGRYRGDNVERDGAYHQGTVWPWLAGPFWSAWLRTYVYSTESRSMASKWLDEFEPHLNEAGIGQVSEVFGGDAPHLPGGCIAQAWSVAELLRLSQLLGR